MVTPKIRSRPIKRERCSRRARCPRIMPHVRGFGLMRAMSGQMRRSSLSDQLMFREQMLL